MYVVIAVNELNCLGCLVAGLNLGIYPNYRGNSAKIPLETNNLEISYLSSGFPVSWMNLRFRTRN